MCKATEYISQLLDIYENIHKEYNNLTNELSQLDKYEQDILHMVEMGGFNACQGYKLAKMISDNRQKRRQVKNEWLPLQNLKSQFVDNSMVVLKKVNLSVNKQNNTLSEATENKSYAPKVIGTTNLKVAVDKKPDDAIRYKKTKEPITVLNKVDNNLYYCQFKNGLKHLLNIENIINADKIKLG